MPARAAATSSGLVGGQPGLVTTRSVPAGGSVSPGTVAAPAGRSVSRSAAASVTVTVRAELQQRLGHRAPGDPGAGDENLATGDTRSAPEAVSHSL